MIGIYKITNLLSGETYIGQSTDIEQRFREHIYHSESYVDEKIHEIGVENFGFEVVELCEQNQLDLREEYYINFYKSNVPGYGYNIVRGGQHNIGESNSNVKLTEKDVYNIREAYNNHERKYDVYERFKHKVTSSYFSSVWEGTSWKHIHYDVYTEQNLEYYKRGTCVGENSDKAIFTNEEVLELRKRYVNESAREIYESVKDRCTFQSLQCILWGRYYSNVPVYDKRNKVWKNE